MPYLSVRTSVSMDCAKKDVLQKELGALIAVIPGKSIDNCMIDITSDCGLFMRGGPIVGAFVDLRLFRPSPDEAKSEFLAGLCKILNEQLGIEKENVYCNLLELPQWGSAGKLLL